MPQLFFKLHGDFSLPPKISRIKYRTEGPPKGAEMVTFDADDDADAFGFGLADVFAARLRREHAKIYAAVAKAPQALIIRGNLDDPDSLDYLRDTVGLIMALLDTGGAVAVFDPFRLDWWTADEWRSRLFEPSKPVPHEHVVLLLSEDDKHPGNHWVHTRGMLKFGRPDLSVRNQAKDQLPLMLDLCNRFIELQALGTVVPEEQPVRMQGLNGDWRCFHGGDPNDPDFNNVHIEIRKTD